MQYSWKSQTSPSQNYSAAHLPPLLAEPVAVYHGRVPAMFLPNGSIDIILSAGSPLPAPWGLTDMLIQVRKHRAFRVPVESADAIRIPLEIGAYGLLTRGDEPLQDGIYRCSDEVRALTKPGRIGTFEYDPAACLSAIAEAIPDARSTAVMRFRQTQEVLEVARFERPHTVRSWSRQSGVPVRRLERMLQSACGNGPKHVLRLLRLSHAVSAMHHDLSLCEIADEYRYSDQSHFTRECRDFTGLSPSALREKVRTGYLFSVESEQNGIDSHKGL